MEPGTEPGIPDAEIPSVPYLNVSLDREMCKYEV